MVLEDWARKIRPSTMLELDEEEQAFYGRQWKRVVLNRPDLVQRLDVPFESYASWLEAPGLP